jgi:hypothetical protein
LITPSPASSLSLRLSLRPDVSGTPPSGSVDGTPRSFSGITSLPPAAPGADWANAAPE